MKRLILSISLLTLAALLLAACGGASAPQAGSASASAAAGTSLDISYPNALPVRNQLLLGTLRLDESAQPLSAAQAAALLPLWQGIRGTMNSGAAAQAETDALLKQIEAGLSIEQLAAIRGWKLTQTDLQAWASSQGIATASGNAPGSGGGSGVPGSGQTLSAEARATRQAERGGAGESSGLSKALVDAVIAHLESKKAN
ncbi:MAG: hypothetical protein FJ011_16210 [Chloroflexi bacterium]|nr:hypothetical protein [Chloroflexota bacterium]